MQNRTVFDLNGAIQQWRKNLALAPALSQQNLDELESHLRDSIPELQLCGLSAQEAFSIAINRIGPTNLVTAEFGKVNRKAIWLDRGLWMLIGIQTWSLMSNLSQSIARNAFVFSWKDVRYNDAPYITLLPIALCMVLQITALIASIWFSWWLIVKWGGRLAASIWPHLKSRFGFAACLFSLIALSSLFYVSAYFAQIAWIRVLKPEVIGNISMNVSFSSGAVWLIQTVFMAAATLILVRNKLRVSQA